MLFVTFLEDENIACTLEIMQWVKKGEKVLIKVLKKIGTLLNT